MQALVTIPFQSPGPRRCSAEIGESYEKLQQDPTNQFCPLNIMTHQRSNYWKPVTRRLGWICSPTRAYRLAAAVQGREEGDLT